MLSEAEQLHVLSYLSHIEYINHLEIHGCRVLDQPFLLHMLDKRGNLRQVTLIDCPNVNQHIIPILSAKYPHIAIRIENTINELSEDPQAIYEHAAYPHSTPPNMSI